MAIPYPNLTSGISSLPDLIQKANIASAGDGGTFAILGYMIMMIVLVVTFIALKDYEPKVSLPATMFIGFVTSTFLSAGLGLINDAFPVLFLLGLAISGVLLFHEKSN